MFFMILFEQDFTLDDSNFWVNSWHGWFSCV